MTNMDMDLKKQAMEYAYKKMIEQSFNRKEAAWEGWISAEREAAAQAIQEEAERKARVPERPQTFGVWS